MLSAMVSCNPFPTSPREAGEAGECQILKPKIQSPSEPKFVFKALYSEPYEAETSWLFTGLINYTLIAVCSNAQRQDETLVPNLKT